MISSGRSAHQANLEGHYAGITSRLIAFVIDIIIISAVIFSTSWFIATTFRLLQLGPIIKELDQRSPVLANLTSIITSPIFYSLISILFIASYYVFFWTIAGQTPGKGIMGLRVLSRRGTRLKVGYAILRYLGYYLSIIPFGLGIIWILIDDRRLAWHDKLAGTCVVYAWEARPDENFLVIQTSKLIARTQALRTYIDNRKKVE